MDNHITGCEYLANMFKAYRVSHIFYIEAMLRMTIREMEKLGIMTIMAHSENAAGYMADGYARISGRPGICMAQSIGAANLTGGVMDAYLAGSPVIALTGKKLPMQQYRNSYQESDHRLFYEAITKFNAEITIPDQLPYLIRQCFRASTTGKPGPSHLDIPNRMGRNTEVATISEEFIVEPKYGQYPPYRPAADDKEIIEAAKAIDNAMRPVIVIGRGARLSNAGEEILALARKADIPVITSPDGKTVIDETDELWSGICGGYGMDCANQVLMEADLVIFIGTQASDQTTNDWKCPNMQTTIIQIDISAEELGRNYPHTIGLLGDAKVVSGQLAGAVSESNRENWRKQVSVYLKETLNEYERRTSIETESIRPERLCFELGKVLPDNAVLVADTGFAAIWSAIMIRMKTSQRFLRAAGSLGWAFPASLGVKCGDPERPVVCFIGDGGFYYHLSEMETAMRYGINTVTVINNNGILKQCSGDIDNVFKDKAISRKHYTFKTISFSKIAEEIGLFGIKVTNADDIGPSIRIALKSGKPAVVEVITDPTITVPPSLRNHS